MTELEVAVQVLPLLQAEVTPVSVPGASVWLAPSEKVVAEIVTFQPLPAPRAWVTPRTGAYETVWSVPSRVLLIDGFDGRLREIPAVPVTVAVGVSVPASAAVDATSATTAIPIKMKIRCLM